MYCLWFAIIKVKSVTPAFDHLGGMGSACGILMVLFALLTRGCCVF
jgi:hypothetical protein